MHVMGCDLGLSKSGIVVLDSQFQIVEQNLIKVKSDGVPRLVDIENAFRWILNRYDSEELEIFIEGYAYGAKYQRESLAELGGIIRRRIYLSERSFWIVPPRKIKLFVTGNGRATKNYMKKCTKERWEEVFKSDDVCDAYGIARLGMTVMKAMEDGTDGLPQNEQEAIEEILIHPDWYKNSSTSKKKS